MKRVTPTDERGVYLVASDTPGQPPWRVEVNAVGNTHNFTAQCGCEIEHRRSSGISCKHCKLAIDWHLDLLKCELMEWMHQERQQNINARIRANRAIFRIPPQ